MMSNKGRIFLFLVFALMTFYQFANYVGRIRIRNLQPQDEILMPQTNLSDMVVVDIETEIPIPPSTPFILLLVLNLVLWVMHPQQIGRLPLSLTFLAYLSIVVIENIAAAVFRQAGGFQAMSIETVLQQIAQRNRLYFILVTINTLIVMGMLIQIWRNPKALLILAPKI